MTENLYSEIRRYLNEYGWKKVASGEYLLDINSVLEVRAFFRLDKKAEIETVIRLPRELNEKNVRQVLLDAGGEYINMFNAKISHDPKLSKCIINLSFVGFEYPFEKLNTYFLAGLYKYIQQDKKLGILLLGHYLKNYKAMFGGNYYDDLSTIVKVSPDSEIHPLSRNKEDVITLHNEAGYYDVRSSVFGETKDNVFLPLLSYFLGNQLILLIPQYGKKAGKGISLFTGIQVLHASKLQRHFRELIRMAKKDVKIRRIDPEILKWHGQSLEVLAGDQVNYIRYYWAFRDFIHDLPTAASIASQDQLDVKITNKIARIEPLLRDVEGCISYSNCIVDYYLKRKTCYEESKRS